MKQLAIAEFLWGPQAKSRYLFFAAIILLFSFLGGREIWTQEHRWADIVSGMFYRHDFLHPYLGENKYYDKPLLSYWFIVLFAKLLGTFNLWALRLPSALSGLLTIWSIYRLGTCLKDRQLGLLSGWLLLTTYYFVFWARTSSADMLNLAGSLFAIAWYFDHREQSHFYEYSIFFIIIALTSLCKGLIGFIVPSLVVIIDIIMQKSWHKHLKPALFLALIPAFILYLAPFLASTYFGGDQYGQSGLYLVYKENFLRYFQPFDHQGPFYTYFIYLPIYLLPWTIFFIPAIFSLPKRWHSLSTSSKTICYIVLMLFLFFSLSGSRRSYYVLPIVPFAILLTADWLLSSSLLQSKFLKRLWHWSPICLMIVFVFLWMTLNLLPTLYSMRFGANHFANVLQSEANKMKPWHEWNIVLLDAESKLNFYLQLPPSIVSYHIKGTDRPQQTAASLLKLWPILKNPPHHTIFISRKLYKEALQPYFPNYRIIALEATPSLFSKQELNSPIAFLPQHA